MLWWLVGIWLASGAVLPAFWLLSMAYHWLTFLCAKWVFKQSGHHPDRIGIVLTVRHMGLYALINLASAGALILLLVSSFCTPNSGMLDLLSASTLARAQATKPAEARPIVSWASAASSSSNARVISATPAEVGIDDEEGVGLVSLLRESWSLSEAAQATRVTAPATVPIYHKASGAERRWVHRPAGGSSADPYAAPPSRGTWLYAPISSGGANS